MHLRPKFDFFDTRVVRIVEGLFRRFFCRHTKEGACSETALAAQNIPVILSCVYASQ
jgi:hypothetical protein